MHGKPMPKPGATQRVQFDLPARYHATAAYDPAGPSAGGSGVLVGSGGARYHLPAFQTSAAAAASRRLPQEWSAHVASAREEIAWTLQTLNPNALELRKVWFDAGYVAARLVDTESGEFLARLPAQVCGQRMTIDCSGRRGRSKRGGL
jgi:hypothetical protein